MLDWHSETVDQCRALRVRDLRRTKPLFNSHQRLYGVRWGPVVITLQGLNELRRRTDYSDARDGGFQREGVVLVFQQYHRFACCAPSELPMLGRVGFTHRNLAVGKA